jgi:hypothetical protein
VDILKTPLGEYVDSVRHRADATAPRFDVLARLSVMRAPPSLVAGAWLLVVRRGAAREVDRERVDVLE